MRSRRWRFFRPAEPHRGLPTAAALVAVFVVLALVTRLVCEDPTGNSSFFPANAALVVALLVLPPRLALLTTGVCFALNLLINAVTAYTPAADNLLFCALNVMLGGGTAFLTRSLCGAAIDLSRIRRLVTFGAICWFTAGIEAAIGCVYASTADASWLGGWLQWTECDGFGLLLATPAILLAIRHNRADDTADAGVGERWLLLAGTLCLGFAGFYYARSPLYLMIYPALILTAFRAGPSWVLSSVLLTAIVASGMTVHGFGPLALLSSRGRLLSQDMMQPYLISLFLSGVPATSALGEKTRAMLRVRRMKAAVEHGANHDSLTTLTNRDLFQRRLRAMLLLGQAQAVCFIDLDRFKQVNDTLGHQAGDELLRAFGDRLRQVAPDQAVVARFGGDEFAILLPHGTAAIEPEAVCQEIVQVARRPFMLARGSAQVGASVGVVLVASQACDGAELMRKADIALYAAKAAGRDGYRVFCSELDRRSHDRAALQADLLTALQRGEGLALHYQIKVACNGAVTGVEALVRWHHPRHGKLAPSSFVPLAEASGLIVPLGNWVFAQAVAFAQRWPQLHVAINVSPEQLVHPGFVADTLAVLRQSGVAAERLELEVTETALVADSNAATGPLAALRAAGLRIALDDFGTGYASLKHLQQFGVDRLKIDQSFVRTLGDAAGSATIVKAVIRLGHAMRLQVTAEGVETAAQRRFLVAEGVDELQGHFFARPVEESALAAVMLQQAPKRRDTPEPALMLTQAGKIG
jgi:diguanylate cyclase (GGDEF)-like protein